MQQSSSIVSLSDDEEARAPRSNRSSISLGSNNMLDLLEDAPHDELQYYRSFDLQGPLNTVATSDEGMERCSNRRQCSSPLMKPPSVNASAKSAPASVTQHCNLQNVRFVDRYNLAPATAALTSTAPCSAPTTSSPPNSPSVGLPRLSGTINVQAVLEALLAERARVDREAQARLNQRLVQVNQRAKEQVAWAQNAERWAQETTEDFRKRLEIINAKEVELQARERLVAQAWAALHAKGAGIALPSSTAMTAGALGTPTTATQVRLLTTAQASSLSQNGAIVSVDGPRSVDEGIEAAEVVKGRKSRVSTTATAKPGAKRSVKVTAGIRKAPVKKAATMAATVPASLASGVAFFPKLPMPQATGVIPSPSKAAAS